MLKKINVLKQSKSGLQKQIKKLKPIISTVLFCETRDTLIHKD